MLAHLGLGRRRSEIAVTEDLGPFNQGQENWLPDTPSFYQSTTEQSAPSGTHHITYYGLWTEKITS
jgi:hypothetical protein